MSVIGISVAGIMVYGLFIIVDIKMISERIEVDDYILGAMTVYIDLMSLFLYILALLGKKKDWIELLLIFLISDKPYIK